MQDLAGRTIGQYRLIEQIGQGGMAAVYRGYQSALNRYVAVKVLPTHLLQQSDFLRRFRQEATAVASLRHPNILAVYDFGQEDEFAYIVMEFVHGGTLKDRLGQALNPSLACRITAQIARALDYAHQQGIIHRDVKPANILMPTDDWALLSDFGIAKIVESPVAYTQPGVGIGTPEYMSPEQGQGLPVDGRSDIYSLGVVLYEMVTGSAPFSADTPLSVVLKHISEPPPRPRSLSPNVPEPLERIILRAMAKRPEDRFQTAGEMAAALEAAAEPTQLMSPGREEVLARERASAGWATQLDSLAEPNDGKPRSPVYLAIGAGVAGILLLSCVGGAAGLYYLSNRPSGEPTSTVTIGVVAPTSTTAPPTMTAPLSSTKPPAPSPTAQRPITPGPATPTPTRGPMPVPAALKVSKGALLFSDEFTNNSAGWDEDSGETSTRYFQDGRYHIVVNKVDYIAWSNPIQEYRFQDFVYEVDATPTGGPDDNAYGVLFRYVDTDNFYRFDISADGQLRAQKKVKGEYTALSAWTRSTAVKQGKQVNKIGVTAIGDTFNFYVNSIYVGSVSDSSLPAGSIGLIAAAYAEGGPGVDIAFDNAKVWEASLQR